MGRLMVARVRCRGEELLWNRWYGPFWEGVRWFFGRVAGYGRLTVARGDMSGMKAYYATGLFM